MVCGPTRPPGEPCKSCTGHEPNTAALCRRYIRHSLGTCPVVSAHHHCMVVDSDGPAIITGCARGHQACAGAAGALETYNPTVGDHQVVVDL